MNATKNQSGISRNSYHTLLKDISQIYEIALSDGNENWNKAALFSNWKIGERIVKVEQGNKERAGYGDRVLAQLSKDLNRKFGKGFTERNLRYMRKFFQMYKLDSLQTELSWTHYRCLLSVENSSERKDLEKKAIQEKWTHRELLEHVNKVLIGKKPVLNNKIPEKPKEFKLKRPLMGLYTFRISENFSRDLARRVPYLDLGFSVRIDLRALGATEQLLSKGVAGQGTVKFKVGAIVRVVKKMKTFSFKSGGNPKELYTYKAYLEKVIDGDTLIVSIDLGFHIFIEQRLRLRGMDAPELEMKQGMISKKFVESKLKDCKFLIIKTHGRDKYDRYLADVFYLQNDSDEEKILKEGIFLNNELLEEGLAEFIMF